MNGRCSQGLHTALFYGWNFKLCLALPVPIMLWENLLWISVHILRFERSQVKCHFDTAKRNTALSIYLGFWEPRLQSQTQTTLAKAFLESTSITQNEKSQNKAWFIEKNYLFLLCAIHQVMHLLVIFHCLHHQFLDFTLPPIFFLWWLFAPRWFITDLLQIHAYSSQVCVIMKILLQRIWGRRKYYIKDPQITKSARQWWHTPLIPVLKKRQRQVNP